MEFRDFSLMATDTKVAEFAEGLARGEVLATRCSACGLLQYPPRSDCPECYSDLFEWVQITGTGRLITYTTIFVAPEHFAPDLHKTAPFSEYRYQPLPVGIVEMENGLRVMGWIRGIPAGLLKVGAELVVASEVLDDGRATVVLQRRVEEA